MERTASVVPIPSRCFCHIAVGHLRPWARLKYCDRLPTMQLLQMAKSAQDREAIGIVALLDLPDDEVVRLLSPLSQAHCRILACRDHVRAWLQEMLGMPQAA